MQLVPEQLELITSEFEFITSRSSGPGGQNVNKLNTRVTIRFNILNSAVLNQTQKRILKERLQNKLSNKGEILVSCQEERSQVKNREIAVQKLIQLLQNNLFLRKKRINTNPTKGSVQRRLEKKKQRSDIKKLRSGKNYAQ
ncbi:MAG: aminoacyl-tRNA hydrolase [Bacteroidales bacterium]|nr:aminoacyl-tRNA hydrolase [Bacteroidales bacterium]MBN2821299.1 aminoacyl-tRNA hydrolase [Bacteroidales bacterium]